MLFSLYEPKVPYLYPNLSFSLKYTITLPHLTRVMQLFISHSICINSYVAKLIRYKINHKMFLKRHYSVTTNSWIPSQIFNNTFMDHPTHRSLIYFHLLSSYHYITPKSYHYITLNTNTILHHF